MSLPTTPLRKASASHRYRDRCRYTVRNGRPGSLSALTYFNNSRGLAPEQNRILTCRPAFGAVLGAHPDASDERDCCGRRLEQPGELPHLALVRVDTALARLQAVATFCGRWLKDLPERLEMQDRIEALGEEVKDLQASRRETFRRTRDLRSTADKLLETTLRNRDTPEFYSYY